MIALVDYGMGNLRSVEKALAQGGVDVRVISARADVLAADALVVPGVGAFGDAMKNIRAIGMVEAIREATREGIPFLGICLGLQVLFTEGEEKGIHRGLDILPGRVRRFTEGLVPQIGWNQLEKIGIHGRAAVKPAFRQ